jgi:hypothetical protein
MANNIIRVLEKAINRRGFLQKLSVTAGAFLTGVFATRRASATFWPEACCLLCEDPAMCSWNPSSCVCVWYWYCKHTPECAWYKCSECLISLPTNCALPCPTSDADCVVCGPGIVSCSEARWIAPIPGCIVP